MKKHAPTKMIDKSPKSSNDINLDFYGRAKI